MVSATMNATGAKDRLRRLKELAQQTGPLLYERAKLAAELLDDRDWLTARFKGDEGQAADWLQAEHFADLGGLISVVALAGVFRTFPQEDDWKEYRYSLKRLYAEWQERTKGEQPKAERRAAKVKDIEERDAKIQELAFEVKRATEDRQRVSDDAAKLAARVRELELENATLKGRVAELERLAGGRTEAA